MVRLLEGCSLPNQFCQGLAALTVKGLSFVSPLLLLGLLLSPKFLLPLMFLSVRKTMGKKKGLGHAVPGGRRKHQTSKIQMKLRLSCSW